MASFSWVMPCDAIPCFVAAQSVSSFCHSSSCCEEKSSPLTALCSINCEEIFLWPNFVLLCQRVRNTAGKNFLVSQTFHYLLDHMVPYSSLCCHYLIVVCQFPLVSSPIFPSFSQDGEFTQATNTDLNGNVCVPIFKMLLPMI